MRLATDEAQAIDILSKTPAAIGAKFVGVVEDIAINQAGRHPNGDTINGYLGWPRDFLDQWQDDFSHLHPTIPRCRFEVMPFVSYEDRDWETLGALTPLQRRLRCDLAKLGISVVLGVPVHLPQGVTAALLWSGDDPARFGREVAEHAHLLMVIAQFFMAKRKRPRPRRDPRHDLAFLTPRQIEMIRFAAAGKTIFETAEILGLSSHTVRKHLRTVFERLDAVNVTHAVAIAAQFGLLTPLRS